MIWDPDDVKTYHNLLNKVNNNNNNYKWEEASNSSPGKAEAEGLGVWGQREPHNETLSQKNRANQNKTGKKFISQTFSFNSKNLTCQSF